MLALAALYLIAGALLAMALMRLLPALPQSAARGWAGARRLFFAGAILVYLLPAAAYLVLHTSPPSGSAGWFTALLFLLPGTLAVLALSLLFSKTRQRFVEKDPPEGDSSGAKSATHLDHQFYLERENAVAELTAAVAHGVRNPLASIRAAAQIAREISEESEVCEILLSVLRESDRLEGRIRHLVEFSKPLEIEERSVDLREVFRNVLSAATRRADIQNVLLEQECPDSLAELRCDPEALENTLFELVSNGLDAMRDGGRLLLSVEAGNGMRSLRVSDTGSGIPDGVRDRIFDLFFTTRPEAGGIGLATVRKTIRGLQGEARLEASTPHGSVFRIDLPKRETTRNGGTC